VTRRPAFWIAFALLGLGGAWTALQLFTVALPIVSLDITMDRARALAAAEELAADYGWGPPDARSAASFGQADPSVQTYVELEGGGRAAFEELIEEGGYQPYQWRVRRFAEGVVEEVEVRFTPGGSAYGFELRLPEDDPAARNLTDEAAIVLAEEAATGSWDLDLAAYRRIEASEQETRGGRVDHTLVYERADYAAGEARVRLRLVVAGDRLSELTHFVYVPEAFDRRYADMRATNESIALVSQTVFLLIFVLLGAGVGTALLLRAGWVQWRAALAWGVVTAVLFGLNAVNALPLSWMGYDTAVSSGTFVLRNIGTGLAIAVFGAPILAFFYLAAESLGRRAFPGHLQQWRFWSPEVARSRPALGLTVAAYLLVGLQLGYVTLFYLGTSRLEGWWSPAEALVQPDLLATYFPWLQAVAVSLFAALWEESVFRAVPIACAALLGARFGRRGLWIGSAVVIQALVFAAGHANYPQQPPYARVIELTLPALVWGGVYVRYGLVPTILAHFLYDLSLISSVLFASDAFFDQSVIVGVAAIPLALVLWARRRGRAAGDAPEWAFNAAWRPEAGAGAASTTETGTPGSGEAAPRPDGDDNLALHAAAGVDVTDADDVRGWLTSRPVTIGATLLGLALWIGGMTTGGSGAGEGLELGRAGAIAAARAEMDARGFDPDAWQALAMAADGRSAAHEYVWEESGPEAFAALLGDALAPPQWIVRFVRWDVEPEERAEEFTVNVLGDGTIRRFAHTLPEGRPGARLPEESARSLALAALPGAGWEEVGSEEEAHDARTDWTFTFRDAQALSDVAAEARLAVIVRGDEVTDVRRFVDLPEEWERERRGAANRRLVTTLGMTGVLVLLFGVAAITAVVVWSRGGLAVGPLLKVAGLAAVVMTASFGNAWPATSANFSTAQPLDFQVIAVVVGLVLVTLVVSASLGLVGALGASWAHTGSAPASATLPGIGLGALVVGAQTLAASVAPGPPAMPSYSEAAAFVPALAAVVAAVLPLIALVASAGALAAAHRRLRGRPSRALTIAAILLVGLLVVPEALRESPLTWLAAGAVGCFVVWATVDAIGALPAVGPIAFTTMAVLGAIQAGWQGAYPGSLVGSLLAVVSVAAIGYAWSRALAPAPGAPAKGSTA